MALSSGNSPVRILHLSDIHFRADKVWDSDPVLRHLASFIGSEVRQGMTPDLVVITGDLAYSGKAEEYRKDGERKLDELPCTAQEWLEDELWPALSPDAAHTLPPDRLLLVPGNHDVDQDKVDAVARMVQDGLLAGRKQGLIAAVLGDRGQCDALVKRHAAYLDFYSAWLGADQPFPWWERTIETQGQRLHVAGLDSAWMACGDTDRGRLLLGHYQINKTVDVREAKGADWSIALLHHPWDYLAEFDSHPARRNIHLHRDLVLRGHLHEGEASFIRPPDPARACLELAAGCVYETSQYPNAFQWIELHPQSDQGPKRVRVLFRAWIRGAWQVDRNQPGCPDGTAEIPFPPPSDLTPEARVPKPVLRWDFWRRHPVKPDVFNLLSWHVRLTKLYGRNGELDELLAWACQEGDEPRVRIVTGPGGVGKTRLAAELCDRLWQGGWETAFLNRRTDSTPIGVGTLWVVDYPEENQRALGEFLRALGARRTGSIPVRVLMLSRQPEEWWSNNAAVRSARVAHLFDTFDLKLVGLGAADTVAMFREACGNLCEWYKMQPPRVTDDDIVQWRHKAEFHAMPLMVVAAALHAVLDPNEALGLMGREVVQSLVKRERDRLDEIGRETARLMDYGPDRVEPTWASRLYGLSAASNGMDADLLRALAQPDLEFGLPDAGRVVELARRLPIYARRMNPPQIEVPRPDIFGAALLYDVLSDRADKAPDWLWTAFTGGKAPKNDDLPDRLGRLIFDVSTVCVSSKQRLSDWLLEMIRAMPERAHLLEPLAKEDRPPDAALPLSIEVNRHLANEDGDAPPVRAERLTQLALHLARADRDDEAVEQARKAVAILRDCGDDATLRAQLARALRVLSMGLSNQHGVADDAVRAAEEAVGIFRMRVDTSDGREELARGLNALGVALQMARRRSDGVAVLEETVTIYRDLVSTNATPGRRMVLLDNLARGLFNLSFQQWDLGRKEDALNSIRESVSLRRDLYAESRWRYGRSFALSLSRLAEYLIAAGDYEVAEEAIDQAISVRRRLVAANPGQFGVGLVSALSTKALIHTNARRAADATAVYHEAIRVVHGLMDAGALSADDPTLANLTMTLVGIVGYNAVENNQSEVAIEACNSVVDLIQRVREEKREQWGANLQFNLMAAYLNRGNAQRKTSDGRQRAIADYTCAIDEGRDLVRLPNRAPESVVYLEVAMLNRCMERLSERGPEDFDDYRATVQMDADLRAELGEKWPLPQHDQLLRSLRAMIDRFKEAKYTVLLAEVGWQAAEIAMGFARRQQPGQEMPTPKSAQQIFRLVDSLREYGLAEKGVPLMREGIRVVDAVLNQSPPPIEGSERARFLNDVGYFLGRMGGQLRDADHVRKAEQWLREAMRLIGEVNVSDFAGELWDSLGFVLTARAELEGDKAVAAEAKAILERSLAIFDQLKADTKGQRAKERLARLKSAI